jgi:hypothetical protein
LYGWLALVAVICFAALVGLQVAEMMYYQSPPTVWP